MNAILEMRGITKTFPGVKALDNVNITVKSEPEGINGAFSAKAAMARMSTPHGHGFLPLLKR